MKSGGPTARCATVVKGLTPEDRVIVNGLMLLRPGVKVELQEAQAEVRNLKSEAENTKAPAQEQRGTRPNRKRKPEPLP